jgi:hypothetical protein
LKAILDFAWHRFSILSSIISDANARAVAVIFYFTFLLPFGLISSLFTDPLHRKEKAAWLERQPVPNDIDSARQQG